MIHVREFARSREDVYKVGRTENVARRVSEYPKGSLLIAVERVRDMAGAETALLERLRVECEPRGDLGREYVEGPLRAVVKALHEVSSLEEYSWSLPAPAGATESGATETRGRCRDPDTCVAAFVSSRRETLSRRTVSSLWLYREFGAFLEGSEEYRGVYLGHNRFTSILKVHYGVGGKPMRLPEHGLCQALLFPELRAPEETVEVDGAGRTGSTLSDFLSMEDVRRGCSIGRARGRVTWVPDLKLAYERAMGRKLGSVDPVELEQYGYKLSDKYENVCKSCKQIARNRNGACCDQYDSNKRERKRVIFDMELRSLEIL